MSSDTVDARLLEILRCPLTGQALRLASEEEKEKASRPADCLLIRADGLVFYPVINGIPLLLPGEGIPSSQKPSP